MKDLGKTEEEEEDLELPAEVAGVRLGRLEMDAIIQIWKCSSSWFGRRYKQEEGLVSDELGREHRQGVSKSYE